MHLSLAQVGPKILAKIEIYILTRAELLCPLCYEMPCTCTPIICIVKLNVIYGCSPRYVASGQKGGRQVTSFKSSGSKYVWPQGTKKFS